MRVFKTKDFARFARKEGIGDDVLVEAIERTAGGLIDANLGGGLVKQRVARPGQGRSRGFRTIIVWRHGNLGIFVYGFAKSRQDNIADVDLADLRSLAALFLGYGPKELDRAVIGGELLEIAQDGKEED